MNVNYNNLYCDYIGATGAYSISDYIDITSNTLAINSSNFTSGTSNILNDKIYITSNTLNNKINTTTNFILNRYDKLIKEQPENSLINTYITNSNVGGEIIFYVKNSGIYDINNATGQPYRVKIGTDGKLYLYYNYNIAIGALETERWVEPINMIIGHNVALGNLNVITGATDITVGSLIIKVNMLDARTTADNLIEGAEVFYDRNSTYDQLRLAFNTIKASFTYANTIYASIVGSLGFGITFAIYGFIQSKTNADYIYNNLNYQLTSNTTMTPEEKNQLIEESFNTYSSNLNDMNTNLSNLNIINGFINSNIQTQQYINSLNTIDFRIDNINISNIYVSSNVLSNLNINHGFINSNIQTQQLIPSLKTSLLNLNSGNITNVNNITSSGKIKENNVFLESTYATINYVNTKLFNNSYSSERLYPPKTFNSYTLAITTSTEILGRSCFKETINLTSDNITYGSGTYNIYSSSSYGNSDFNRRNLFNFTVNTAAFFENGNYNYDTGYFNRTDLFLKNYYFGDWVVIKLLSTLILNRFKLYYTNIYSAPALWRLYGSNDGLIFYEIPEGGNFIDPLNNDNYSGGFYEKIFDNTKEYLYIGIVINKIIGGNISASYLNFGQFQLYGVNVNNYSNVYTTSNAVKGIVEFDMPIVSKHYAFYITITTPIVINAKTYYKYDVDLRQYTKLGYIDIGSASGDSYRIFKLRCCFGNMYFSTLVNSLPDVLYSDIFMSMKAAGTGGLGAAGLNICSIGNINNPRLDTVPPNNLFFMRNGANSIDYITVVSTSQADVRCFIEDMIS